MKSSRLLNQFVYLLVILTFSLSFCSFSSVPAVKVLEGKTPIEKKKATKEQRRQQRLNKRYNRLYKRFDAATNSKKRHRLQQKIQQVERQQNDVNPAFTVAVISFIVSLTALTLLVLSFLVGGASVALALISLLLVIPGFVLSLIALRLGKKNPEKNGKAFAIIALIMSIATFVLFIAYILRDFTSQR